MYSVDPVDRQAVIPVVSSWIASEDLPVSTNTLPCSIIPSAFQYSEPFCSASQTSSWACAAAAA